MPDRTQSRTVVIIGSRGYPSYYGGFETAVRKLAPYLAARDWNVVVYGRPGATLPDDPNRDSRVESRTTRGIESKALSTLSFGFTSVVDAARFRPDVALVVNVANGFWLPLLRFRHIPTLVNVDGMEWDRSKWGRVAKLIFRVGGRITAWVGDRLVYDSVEIARRWKQQFGTDGVFIPYGGDVPADLPVAEGLSHRGYALVVARFVPENSIGEFIEAADDIARTHDVIIVGSSGYGGALEDAVEALAANTPRVRWIGHVADDAKLQALWVHAGVYFHGHSVGGTNPALVQAMACGAPIVARDTVYNREVLASGGLFVQPEPRAIARALREVLSDPVKQEELSRAARERFTAKYSWDEVCASYERALLRLIDGRK